MSLLLHTALFSVSASWFFSHSILPSWAHAQFTEEKGAREVNGIGQGSAAGWPPRLGLRTPVLQCKSPYSRGLLPAPTFSQLFLLPAWSAPSWPGPPGTGQVGQGCPSLITSPSPRGPCLCSRSLCFVCYPVCDSPPLLFKAAYFIHHRQQFIFPGESFAWFH